MGLGFGARGETVWLENGDRGEDSDSLRFYVAITLPHMPLSKIDGMVNQFFPCRAKERHLIFGACWRDCSVWYEIKFSGRVGGTARHVGVVLSRDRNLFRVLIGNEYAKMLLT